MTFHFKQLYKTVISACVFLTGNFADDQTPVPIGCRNIDQVNTPFPQTTITAYSCLNSPTPGSTNTVTIPSQTEVNFYAGETINLGPGFEADALAAPLEFNAEIRPTDIEVVEFPQQSPGHVQRFTKYELGLKLPDWVQANVDNFLAGNSSIGNPFNPDFVSIDVVFQGPTSTNTHKRHGFYYAPVNRNVAANTYSDASTDYPWRIRFAPDEYGEWQADITVTINNSTVYTIHSIPFYCVTSDHKGYLKRHWSGGENKRYLRYSGTNETYFGIGENINWGPSTGGTVTPQDADQYQLWLNELADARGNLCRVGMAPWWYNIEWEELNNYHPRRTQMAEFDRVVETAENRKLYLMLHIEIHNAFLNDQNWVTNPHQWITNPYLDLATVDINDPVSFFVSQEARAIYQHKLRYIHARWGYSPYLAFYELLSEVDNVFTGYDQQQNTHRVIFHDWFIHIRDYFKLTLEAPQLISASTEGGDDQHTSSKFYQYADVSMIHQYDVQYEVNYKGRWKRTKNLLDNANTSNQPIIHNESGTNHHAPLDCCTDNPIHNAIWATSMQGNFGCGMNWWWDFATHPNGYQSNYTALAAFFEGEDLGEQQYTPYRWRQGGNTPKEQHELEVFHMVSGDKEKALGWVHFQHYFWPNYRFDLPCVQKLMDDNNGFNALVCADPNDSTQYSTFQGKSFEPNTNVNEDVKIKGLKANKYYQITWWRTDLNGGPDATFNVRKKTNFAGNLMLDYPDDIGTDATDWGIKIVYDDDKSLDLPIDTRKNEIKEPTYIKKNENDNHIIISPNPADQELSVRISDIEQTIKHVEIYNALGEKVYSERPDDPAIKIEIRDWQNGVYFLRCITSNGEIFSSKFIKT